MISGAICLENVCLHHLQSSSRVALSWDLLTPFLFRFRVPEKMTTQAPTFQQPLQSVVVLEGSTATFEAHISGKLTRAHLPAPSLLPRM